MLPSTQGVSGEAALVRGLQSHPNFGILVNPVFCQLREQPVCSPELLPPCSCWGLWDLGYLWPDLKLASVGMHKPHRNSRATDFPTESQDFQNWNGTCQVIRIVSNHRELLQRPGIVQIVYAQTHVHSVSVSLPPSLCLPLSPPPPLLPLLVSPPPPPLLPPPPSSSF